MSRLFDDASSQFLQALAAPVTAPPFTLLAWFKTDVPTTEQFIMCISDKDSNFEHYGMTVGTGGTANLRAYIRSAAEGSASASTSTTVSANTWYLGAVVFTTTTSRTVLLNGAGKGTNTTLVNPLNMDNIAIGVNSRTAKYGYMSGNVAAAVIISAALTDNEILAIYNGKLTPEQARPGSVAGYWPLWGNHSPEIDLSGNNNHLTVTGATAANDPPLSIRYFTNNHEAAAAAVVAATATIQAKTSSASFAIIPGYEIWIGNQVGTRQVLLDEFTDLNITLALNRPGAVSLTFPGIINNRIFDYSLLVEDAWIEIWRGVNGLPKKLVGETPFLLVEDEIQRSAGNSTPQITITGMSAAHIFDWPIVAYNAGNSYTGKTDYLDDMIKEIAAENVGASATDTDRDMSAYITIQADSSDAPSKSKSFARRNLARVFTDLADQSATNGTRLYWDVVLPNPGNLSSRVLELRTYTDQRGTNRGTSVDAALVFSIERGNLERIARGRDYSQAVNYAYGLGQNTEAARNVQTANDATRIANSIWGRIKEGSKNASYGTSDASVTAEAESLVRERRPKITWTASVVDIPSTMFGVHWDHGDMVVVEEFGERKNAIISPVRIRYNNGQEKISATLQIES